MTIYNFASEFSKGGGAGKLSTSSGLFDPNDTINYDILLQSEPFSAKRKKR